MQFLMFSKTVKEAVAAFGLARIRGAYFPLAFWKGIGYSKY